MKNLIIAIVLIGLIYVVGQIVFSEINTYINDASLIMTSINAS